MRGVAEKKFYGEAADLDVSAAEGIKKGGVGRAGSRERERCRW